MVQPIFHYYCFFTNFKISTPVVVTALASTKEAEDFPIYHTVLNLCKVSEPFEKWVSILIEFKSSFIFPST